MKTFLHFWRYLAKLLLKWEMFWTEVVEKMKTHILCSITFFRKSHRIWYNVKYVVETGRATNDVTIWRIRVACSISKAICTYGRAHAHDPRYPHAHTHARTRKHAHTDQYVILIAFPQQQFIRERASMLRYTYIACLVSNSSQQSADCNFQ